MRTRLKNIRAKIENVKTRLRKVKTRLGNIKTRLRNIILQRFFLKNNKKKHLQLYLPNLDGNVTKY